MAHARQQIRDAVRTLVTGLTTTGSRVYPSRVYPSGSGTVPGLCIYTLNEKRSASGDSGRKLQKRELTLVIEARVKPPSGVDVDAQLDTIAAEVEVALATDPTLGGLVSWSDLQETSISLSGKLERPVGVAKLAWACAYKVAADAPDVLPAGAV
jgi:hypothetical protein